MTRFCAVIGVCLLTGLWACAAAGAEVAIHVRSSDPTRVTGGDALIEIVAPAVGQKLNVTANGRDVAGAFKPTMQPGHYLGVVTGLSLGNNTIVASQASNSAKIKLVNHPITGPVFAGPKEKPFYCETSKFKVADGTRLPDPSDADCSVKTVVTYIYKANGSKTFQALPSRAKLPDDIAQTTTTTGQKVPYVVRLEVGTIDRGIYQIAVLHDPTTEAEPTPLVGPKAWNKRMMYIFAGGCLGMYRQGEATGPLLDDQFIGQGYLAMSNSLNVFAQNCDDLLAAESMMMTRERALKMVGLPLFTLGWGCSGGSHQVLEIADNYPGLMDGIIPMCNSVDWTRLQQLYSDVKLVYDWFESPAGRGLTTAQKEAIAGTPLNTAAFAQGRSIATACQDIVPEAEVYHPKTNPKGVRCMISEHQVNSIGRNPKTGYARALNDNVGVQYGLGAFEAGVIGVAQFLDLNEQIGGYDLDGERSMTRSVGDVVGIKAYYRSGRVLNAGLGLRDIPIVELRNYSDRDVDAVHTKYGTYAFRARLIRETGSHANHIVLLESHRPGFMSASKVGGDDMSHYALTRMDEWLTALAVDLGSGTRAEKLARTKPVDLADSCYDEEGLRIVEEQTVSGGRCNALYPTHLPPRMVAGGPLVNDVLKCQFKPVSAKDYKVSFTAAEFTRLKAIFPKGVCDWSKLGMGQVPPKSTWQSF